MERRLNIPEICPYEPVNTYVKRIADANVIGISDFYKKVLEIPYHPESVIIPLNRLSLIVGISKEVLRDQHTIFPALRYFMNAASVEQAENYLNGTGGYTKQYARFYADHLYFDTVFDAVTVIPGVDSSNQEFVRGLLMDPKPMNLSSFGAICLLHAVCENIGTSPLLHHYTISSQGYMNAAPSLILSDAISQFQTAERFIAYIDAHQNVFRYSSEEAADCTALIALSEGANYPIAARFVDIADGYLFQRIMERYPELIEPWKAFMQERLKDPRWNSTYLKQKDAEKIFG